MGLRIDLASFTCSNCGHRSTAPDAVNAFAGQMEERAAAELSPSLPRGETTIDADTESKIADLKQRYKGNDFVVETRMKPDPDDKTKSVIDKKIVRFVRSYANVKEQSGSALEDSDHIVLACPQCGAQLYEVTDKRLLAAKHKEWQQNEKRRALAEALELIKKQGGDIDEVEALRKAGLQKIKLPQGGFKIIGL